MKATLLFLFLVVFAWCCFGCGIGGDPDPNNGSQVDTIPDSIRVKDTLATLTTFTSYHLNKTLKELQFLASSRVDTVKVVMLLDDNTTVVRKVIGWKVSDSVYLNYEKTKRIDFNKVIVAKVKQ